MAKSRIAYIMSRFPGLSETFILREMCNLEFQGWNLELYPLIFQQENVVHNDALPWMERAHRPSLSQILLANLKLLSQRPILYFSTLLKAILGNRHSAKFLLRALVLYPKAVWMAQEMQVEKIAHIHAHYATHPALVAWIINQITGISYSVTVHAHDIFVNRSMLDAKLRNAKAIIAISRFNRDYLQKHLGDWVIDKITIVHCGIEPELYAPQAYPDLPDPAVFQIVSIGSLRPYKGFTFLLDACSILRERGLNYHCKIIGGGELRDVLQSKIKMLGLHDLVELAGPKNQNEVADFLKRADCYIQPSIITAIGKMEGIPVSLMEAMASGLPVIATNISGIPELVQPGKTGYLVPPEDPVVLANAVMDIYNNPDTSKHFALNGREHVLAEFDVLTNVKRLSVLFESHLKDNTWK